jgi:hypothetical protein
MTTAFAMVPLGARAAESSADAYGYYWVDSNAPDPAVTFNWIDISSTGTDVGFYYADNDYVTSIPIGFDFEFYGAAYPEVSISCNGYLQLGGSSSEGYNYEIPDTSEPNNIIAPFWDDLIVYNPDYNYGAVYFETVGASPDRQFVVEFYEVTRSYNLDQMTFEVILNETGEIWFQYLSTNGDTGLSASVGIENADGSSGCSYSYHTGSIMDGLAVMFDRGPVGFGPDAYNRADWGTPAVYHLTVTNAQSFTDSFDISVDSTVLGWTVTLYDSSYNLLVDHNGNSDPDTGALAPGESVSIYAYIFVPDPPSDMNETTVLLASSFSDPAVGDTATLTTVAYLAHLTPFHTSCAIDNDLDGDYDVFMVNISVDALVGGGVLVFANMYTASSVFVTYAYSSEIVSAGSTNFSVYLSGEDIYRSLEDGPYNFELILYDTFYFQYDSAIYTTDPYLYTDFDPPAAVFIPPPVCFAVDADSNGLYDYLVIEATIEVFEAGSYELQADLEDEWGTDIAYDYNETYFDVGVHTAWIVFPAPALNLSGVDGSCWVFASLFMDGSSWADGMWSYTGDYYWGDFEGPPVTFVPPYDEYTTDADTDGYLDSLTITLYIECFEDGVYDISIGVFDPLDYAFGWFHEFGVYMTAGEVLEHDVVLDGGAIYTNGISGYFHIDMYLYENVTHEEIDIDYYDTSYYYYYDFEPMGADFDSVGDSGRDTDSDGYYNEVVVTIYIDPNSTGYYELEVAIYDYYGYWFDTIVETVYMEEDVQEVYEVVIDGYDILANGVQGSFYLEMYIYDETGSYYFDDAYYYTSYYYLSDFDPIGAYFEPPYEDYGVDADSDGLYDALVVTVYVAASSTGHYDLGVDVYDPWYNYAYSFWLELYLVEGTVTGVDLEIDSYTVWNQDVNGYWYFEAYLYDHYLYTEYDYDSFTTAGYYYVSDFDPPAVLFDPPHNDYGLDVDSDSYYDLLIVQVSLYCSEPGEYTVTADLYDPWWNFIATLSTTETLEAGSQTVDFAFEGWMIWYQGLNGYNFVVELSVEDSIGDVMDYDTHYTDYYYWYDFESPPGEFSPPHSDYAADWDADGLYDALVVNASVEVFNPGEYIVVGILYDEYGDAVDVAYTTAALDDGIQEVQLTFPAWSISVAGGDPWYVELQLMDFYENVMDTGIYYLGLTYAQADFDPSVPTIEAGWAYDAPTIDGTVTLDEWFGAEAVDFLVADPVNQLAADIYVLNNGTHLFVLIDATGDLTQTEGDSASVSFDTYNDALASLGHEDQFVLQASDVGADTSHWVYDGSGWTVDCYPFDQELTDHAGLAGAAGFGVTPGMDTPHRVYELCIPLALLDVSIGETIGFAGLSDNAPGVTDAEEDDYSTWPAFYWTAAPWLDEYGDLVLSEEPPLTAADLSGDAGAAGWFLSDVEVTLTATGGTGGVANTSYDLDGEGWQTYTEPFAVEGDGVHTVQFYSIDMDGNEEPVRTVLVMIDTVAPEANATADGTAGSDGWFTSAATVTFEVDDETSGFACIMYSLDGDDWEALAALELVVDAEGAHTMEYYAVDVAGLEGDVLEIAVRVDTAAPVTTSSVDGYTVTLSVTDSASGSAVTMYRMDDGEWLVYDGAFDVVGKGNYTVEFYSTDAAGNDEAVQSIVVEGKAQGILGIDTWVWAVAAGVAIAAVVAFLFLMTLMRKRKGQQPQTFVPVQGYAEQPPTDELPPPPQ